MSVRYCLALNGAKGPGSAGTGTTAGSDVASTTPKAGVFWNKTTVLDRTVYQGNRGQTTFFRFFGVKQICSLRISFIFCNYSNLLAC